MSGLPTAAQEWMTWPKPSPSDSVSHDSPTETLLHLLRYNMRVAIRLSDLGSPSARFSGWFVQPGDAVHEGERMAEVLLPGVAVDVLAPAAGLLAARFVRNGQVLESCTILGEIETGSGLE